MATTESTGMSDEEFEQFQEDLEEEAAELRAALENGTEDELDE